MTGESADRVRGLSHGACVGATGSCGVLDSGGPWFEGGGGVTVLRGRQGFGQALWGSDRGECPGLSQRRGWSTRDIQATEKLQREGAVGRGGEPELGGEGGAGKMGVRRARGEKRVRAKRP